MMTGLMPAGGLKELQRRKQAAGESGESKVVADCAAESTPEPGQLQHVSRSTLLAPTIWLSLASVVVVVVVVHLV